MVVNVYMVFFIYSTTKKMVGTSSGIKNFEVITTSDNGNCLYGAQDRHCQIRVDTIDHMTTLLRIGKQIPIGILLMETKH